MNNALNQLQPYPFEKLRALLGGVTPAADKRAIALSIGEPKHTSPAFVAKALADNLDQMAVYPPVTWTAPPVKKSWRFLMA